jgi:hypothetical protein
MPIAYQACGLSYISPELGHMVHNVIFYDPAIW